MEHVHLVRRVPWFLFASLLTIHEGVDHAYCMAREPTTKPTSSDVGAFLDALPDEARRTDARQLCTLMAEVTGEPPVLRGSSIVGFGTSDYRYDSGHKGTSALAALHRASST
jgi:hypothetical protein